MALNVVQFYKLKPRLPFQFKTKWYTSLVDDDGLTYCVKSINLPKMEIENNIGFSFFGNAIKSVPTYSPGARKLEITFEENDYMLVSTFIDSLVHNSYSRNPYYITIQITQFDTHFQRNSTKGYVCHLSSYEEPSFKRDGQAQPIDISAVFIVDTVIPNFTEADVVKGTIIKNGSPAYNPKMKSLIVDEQNQKFEFGNFKFGNDDKPKTKKYNSGDSYKDFKVNDMETKAALEHFRDDNFSNISEENVRAVQIENAKRMETAYNKFKAKLLEKGYNVGISTYNDANHVTGVGSVKGSHLLGSKIDLLFFDPKNPKARLLPQNMSKEDIDFILQAAHEAGFVANWERNSKEQISGWGDFVLANAQTITSNNEIKEIKTSTWTGERTVVDSTDTKNRQEIGK